MLYLKIASLFIKIFTILIFVSCSKKEESSAISIDLDQGKSYLVSEILDDIDYILLDYPDEKPIIGAYKMLFTDKNIIVESRENAGIFIFDLEGELQNRIQSYGDGPGEFRIFDEMFLLDKERIRIHCQYSGKYLIFDLNGDFLEEGKIESGSWSYLGENFTLSHFPNGELAENFTFIRKSAVNTTGYAPLRKGGDQFYKHGYVHSFVASHQNEKIFLETNTNNIYIFDTNGFLKDSIIFDFGKYQMDWDTKVRIGKDREAYTAYYEQNEKVERIGSFFPVPSGYFLSATYNYKNPKWILLDMDLNVNKIISGIKNDIDGFPLRQWSWTFDRDYIVYQMDSRTFFNDYVKTFEGQKVNLSNSKLHLFFDRKKDALKEEKIVLVKMKLSAW